MDPAQPAFAVKQAKVRAIPNTNFDFISSILLVFSFCKN
jgi:hypothetical protein